MSASGPRRSSQHCWICGERFYRYVSKDKAVCEDCIEQGHEETL